MNLTDVYTKVTTLSLLLRPELETESHHVSSVFLALSGLISSILLIHLTVSSYWLW